MTLGFYNLALRNNADRVCLLDVRRAVEQFTSEFCPLIVCYPIVKVIFKMADQVEVEPSPQLADDLRNHLAECVEQDQSGRQRLTVTLPDSAALDKLAHSLARLLAVQKT